MQLSDETVGEYADQLIAQVTAGGGPTLDYSLESIRALEALFAASDGRFADGIPDEASRLVIFYNGCFLGCALAANFGGVWQFDSNWFESGVVFGHGDGGLMVRPFEKVWRRITEGPEGNDLAVYAEALSERLRQI